MPTGCNDSTRWNVHVRGDSTCRGRMLKETARQIRFARLGSHRGARGEESGERRKVRYGACCHRQKIVAHSVL